ncbi:MAG: hypothetical protein EAZ08_13335 [Cytophagales bacterium]|nr:MAG: hypothetical protein EAZ08_13335 [Cytophagales bacterium]
MSFFARAQNLSFESLCKSKKYKDSLQMNIMQSNINLGTSYKYHIVQVQRPNTLYKTTYFYPLMEKGLNREVYRTNSIDMGNVYRNGVYRDSFNRYGAFNMSSAAVNGLLGVLFK